MQLALVAFSCVLAVFPRLQLRDVAMRRPDCAPTPCGLTPIPAKGFARRHTGVEQRERQRLKGSKMPRGSKPGERRGGRQRGTPNKSTVLKNAATAAAANDPNLSPLDFLL